MENLCGIAERLKYFRDKHLGLSQKEFGLAVGAAGRDTVYNWEKGKNVPNAKYLTEMRIKFSLNPEWLLSGIEPMLIDAEEKLEVREEVSKIAVCPTHINIDLLAQILEKVEQHLAKNNRTLPHYRKALAISLIYDYFWESNADVMESVVERYMKLA